MKMYFTRDESPARPRSRRREYATIPPFSLYGPLDVSDSGLWYPARSLLLTGGTITASNLPPTDEFWGLLQVIRLDDPRQETSLAVKSLSPRKYQTTFTFMSERSNNPPIISPFEPVFIRSLVASGHENVVIQLVGEYVS
jgi:hypothetical protein